jgi:PASTA domain-containing protein
MALPVGASQKADLAWVHRWGGHLAGVLLDVRSAGQAATKGSISGTVKSCRQWDADASSMLTNEPPLPGHTPEWTKDLLALQAVSVLCIGRAEAGASAVNLTALVIIKGEGAKEKLLNLLPKGSLKGDRTIHVEATGISVAPATTTTTAPPAPTTTTTAPPPAPTTTTTTKPPPPSPPSTTAPGHHTAQSAPPGIPGSVPNVTGQNLDQAEGTLLSENLGYQTFGGGTFGVVIASDWTVCSQSPAPGTISASVNLVVARSCS